MLKLAIIIMIIELNGNKEEFENYLTVEMLLDKIQIEKSQVAVEVNGRILQKSLHKDYIIKDNDKIEIVEFIGGG